MEYDEAIDIRCNQRQQYLENSNFKRLSDILTDKNNYCAIRDDYVFLYLLYGFTYKSDTSPTKSVIEKIFLENHKKKEINWPGIYEYYQARSKSINENKWFKKDDDEIQNVIYVLKKHKDKIFKNYTTF